MIYFKNIPLKKIIALNSILKTSGLTKKYGPVTALSNLSLEVEKGAVFGLLGPNGSGKTTTLGIILGVINASSGNYSWFDNNEADVNRKRIGALLENPNFYPYLTSVQNLKISADIKKVGYERIDEVLKLVNLYERRNSSFSGYSLGMKQRLAIASALLANPEVLVLDEPTNGLDPQGIAEVRGLINQIAKEGKTIILASHLLDEVEKVCTHVGVLQKGKLLAQGNVTELFSNDEMLEASCDDNSKILTALQGESRITKIAENNGKVMISAKNLSASELNSLLFHKGITINHLASKKKSLESHFLELISKN